MLLGLHHVTALAGNAQRNLDFYRGAAGLRLVKRTVNFDDPASHHLYFGAENGTPGSLLTFFPWATSAHPHGAPARRRRADQCGDHARARISMLETLADPDGLGIKFVPGREAAPAIGDLVRG